MKMTRFFDESQEQDGRTTEFMTTTNSTLTEDIPSVSLLWIPYVAIAAAFLGFLGVHFWCYHKRNREKFMRKLDEKRVKDGLLERRKTMLQTSPEGDKPIPTLSNQCISAPELVQKKEPVNKYNMTLPVGNNVLDMKSNYKTFSNGT